MKKNYLFVFLALAVVLSLSTIASSTSEEDLAFLRNYAVQNYGLDNESIQLQYIAVDLPDFRCSDWYGHGICQAGFIDKYDKTVELYWDKDTGSVYDYKPSFHQLHPEVSPKIDAELYNEMLNADPTQEIQIRVTKKSPITELEIEELEEIGMNVTLTEDKPKRWLQLTGYMSVAYGKSTQKGILDIANLRWVYGIYVESDVYLHMPILDETNLSTPFNSALIVSNSVDMPTAEKLKVVFNGFNISSEIINASEFQNRQLGYDMRFILGGPEAYEGVGELSALYLSEKEKDYLIIKTGTYGFWSKVRVIGKYNKRIIIIAGHTRNETALAEMEFESKGLTGEGLLIV